MKLKVGSSYYNKLGLVIKIAEDRVDGFRFRGDNGFLYLEDGRLDFASGTDRDLVSIVLSP